MNIDRVSWICMHFPISVPNLLRDRTNLAIFYRLTIKARYRHYTTRRCAHEDLIRLISHLHRHNLNI